MKLKDCKLRKGSNIILLFVAIAILMLTITSCSGSAGGQERPSIPVYEFYCRHEAVLAAIAIEPYCEEEPIIVVGYVEELGLMHAEAECPSLGYIRIVGTRTVGAYSSPAWTMVNEKVYSVSEYLKYFFGWTMEE